ncbi:MAG: hypothetical protein KC620_00140 [Myxococcales bacterium]|nr:hypothetical protein [Myxococcales bacterium]
MIEGRKVKWYGLFIGLDDYADARLGDRGAVNDAKAWWATTRQWALPPERVVIATSPQLAPAALGEGGERARLFSADHAGFAAALTALIKAVDGDPDARVLLAWSGHAAAGKAGEGTRLAVADFAGDPARLVSLAQIVGRLCDAMRGGADGFDGPEPAVLAFVDAGRGAIPAATGAPAGPSDVRLTEIGALVMTAGAPDEQAQVIDIGGARRGAFSWAVNTLLGRFGALEGASALTPADLHHRTRALLDAIAAPQSPMLFAAPERFHQPLLPGLMAQASAAQADDSDDMADFFDVSPRRKRERASFEIYPGLEGKVVEYDLRAGDGKLLGTLYIAGSGVSAGWAQNTEYWTHGVPEEDFTMVCKGTIASTTPCPPSGTLTFPLMTLSTAPSTQTKTPDGAFEIWKLVGYSATNAVKGSTTYTYIGQNPGGTIATFSDETLMWRKAKSPTELTSGTWYTVDVKPH